LQVKTTKSKLMQIVKEELEAILDEQDKPKWAKEYEAKKASGELAGSWEGAGSHAAWGRKERSPEFKKQKEKGNVAPMPSHLLKGSIPLVNTKTPGKWVDTNVKENNMKLTKSQLKQIIQEELELLNEKKEKTKVSKGGGERVSKKIAHLVGKEGMSQERAAAVAYSMESRGELKKGGKHSVAESLSRARSVLYE